MSTDNRPASAELLGKLKWGSTWALLGLAIITFGVYIVYYARRQTVILNQSSSPDKQISMTYFDWWFVVTYSSLALLVVYFFVPDDSIWIPISDWSDRIDTLMGLIWAFMARTSFHRILLSEKGKLNWFHGFWTFLFQSLYINFKINKLNEASPVATVPPPLS